MMIQPISDELSATSIPSTMSSTVMPIMTFFACLSLLPRRLRVAFFFVLFFIIITVSATCLVTRISN